MTSFAPMASSNLCARMKSPCGHAILMWCLHGEKNKQTGKWIKCDHLYMYSIHTVFCSTHQERRWCPFEDYNYCFHMCLIAISVIIHTIFKSVKVKCESNISGFLNWPILNFPTCNLCMYFSNTWASWYIFIYASHSVLLNYNLIIMFLMITRNYLLHLKHPEARGFSFSYWRTTKSS